MNRPAAGARGSRARRRIGLRARVALLFGVGALVLALVVALLAFGVARKYLLHERQNSAVQQTFVDAQLVRTNLRTSQRTDVTSLLGSLPTSSESLVYREGHWFASSAGAGPSQLPAELKSHALAGQPVTQRFELTGTRQLAVAVPLPAVDAVYVEVFSLSELDSTLRILSASLALAAVVTAAAGAILGWWASRRVLQPLTIVAAAAGEIAGGRMDTRLAVADPDLARLSDAFNAMADTLQARLARDARFASDVSHELRTPLTTLATSLSVLEADTNGWSGPQRQALGMLGDELASFQRLVQDLLEISRSDADSNTLVLDDVLFGEFVLRVVVSTASTSVPVEIAESATSTVVQLDKRRMERVFANLLDNADRYGGGATRVAVSLPAAETVRVEVDDAGPGVPVADRERIFERFARGGGGHRVRGGGVGLGLAIVEEHVRLHSGRVRVEEAPGGGARFVVELPVSSDPAAGMGGRP